MSEQDSVPVSQEGPRGSPQVRELTLEIVYGVDELPAAFANHMTIQLTEHECVLNFYQMVPPMEASLGREAKTITPKCVARIGIPKTRLKNFVDTLGSIAKLPAIDARESHDHH